MRPEHLALVRSILDAHVPNATVWVFGSRARGTAKPTSDLDLALVGSERVDSKILGNLRDAFEESALPMKVDVVDWGQTSPSFRKIIEEQKVAL